MIALLVYVTFKMTPSADEFCYPPDDHRIVMCYWPNGVDCAMSATPWKFRQLCGAARQLDHGVDELKEELIVDVVEH